MKKKQHYYLELGQTAVLFVLLHYFLENEIFSYVGLGFVALGVLFWQIRYYNHFIWKYINLFTQTIGEFILLFVLYVALVIPIGFVFKLRNRKKENTQSTLVDLEKPFTADEFKKSW